MSVSGDIFASAGYAAAAMKRTAFEATAAGLIPFGTEEVSTVAEIKRLARFGNHCGEHNFSMGYAPSSRLVNDLEDLRAMDDEPELRVAALLALSASPNYQDEDRPGIRFAAFPVLIKLLAAPKPGEIPFIDDRFVSVFCDGINKQAEMAIASQSAGGIAILAKDRPDLIHPRGDEVVRSVTDKLQAEIVKGWYDVPSCGAFFDALEAVKSEPSLAHFMTGAADSALAQRANVALLPAQRRAKIAARTP